MRCNCVLKSPFFKYSNGSFKFWSSTKRVRLRNYTNFVGSPSVIEKEMPCDRQSEAEVKISFSSGNEMHVSTGKLAKLADGSAVVSYGGTSILATAVSKESKSDSSFTPLTVFYQQKAAALGRIPLNFFRRDIGQTEQEILTSRMIDRSIRPLFPEGFNWDTQIVCSPLALDGNNYPDVLAINAASAALSVSNIPWNGPVGAIRLGLLGENEILVNPSKKELMESKLNLVLAIKDNKLIIMLEGSASNVLLQDFTKAVSKGVKECQKIVSELNKLKNETGKRKRTFECPAVNQTLKSAIEKLAVNELSEIFKDSSHHKQSRDEAVVKLKNSVLHQIKTEFPSEETSQAETIFNSVCKNVFRDLIFSTEVRCDGRGLDDLRPIKCEVDLFKPLHGSALFQRGQTQVLCTVALDSPNAALKLDKVSMLTTGLKEKNFFVHYQFPPFATNEVGRVGIVGRREHGHGALAEKGLMSNIPDKYPFTIRLTSEVLESNGSSSMATVCGGSLALLDAGVPLHNPCAGVAMGLITKFENGEIANYKILTDLLGIEDYMGDMDFKIAGTKTAITAIQMDVKIPGIPLAILTEILGRAKNAYGKVLRIMEEVCPKVREEKKENWPVIKKFTIPMQSRSKFIGPGGINIKKIEMETGVEITEESPGSFELFASNSEAAQEAEVKIQEFLKLCMEPVLEFGGVYTATITEIKDHGCMVTLSPYMAPVHLHVSQLDRRQVLHPSALGLNVGDTIKVKYFGRDPVSGAVRLSRKVLMGEPSEVLRKLASQQETTNFVDLQESQNEKNQKRKE